MNLVPVIAIVGGIILVVAVAVLVLVMSPGQRRYGPNEPGGEGD